TQSGGRERRERERQTVCVPVTQQVATDRSENVTHHWAHLFVVGEQCVCAFVCVCVCVCLCLCVFFSFSFSLTCLDGEVCALSAGTVSLSLPSLSLPLFSSLPPLSLSLSSRLSLLSLSL